MPLRNVARQVDGFLNEDMHRASRAERSFWYSLKPLSRKLGLAPHLELDPYYLLAFRVEISLLVADFMVSKFAAVLFSERSHF